MIIITMRDFNQIVGLAKHHTKTYSIFLPPKHGDKCKKLCGEDCYHSFVPCGFVLCNLDFANRKGSSPLFYISWQIVEKVKHLILLTSFEWKT